MVVVCGGEGDTASSEWAFSSICVPLCTARLPSSKSSMMMMMMMMMIIIIITISNPQASKQARKQAGRQAGRQACRQAGKQASKQTSTQTFWIKDGGCRAGMNFGEDVILLGGNARFNGV